MIFSEAWSEDKCKAAPVVLLLGVKIPLEVGLELDSRAREVTGDKVGLTKSSGEDGN
jgi:hypothetical protein